MAKSTIVTAKNKLILDGKTRCLCQTNMARKTYLQGLVLSDKAVTLLLQSSKPGVEATVITPGNAVDTDDLTDDWVTLEEVEIEANAKFQFDLQITTSLDYRLMLTNASGDSAIVEYSVGVRT